ncbi:recombinase RarA [Parafrankia colletiae]|uniref:Recombinase RarA n=1 Tax=Parafrankia colletiae TaxID=573497 RepID=A0A1S1R5K5_9ACTN|nr:replication-associated recombination protein A [Parafrankia colletiae]MCK9903484.1 replication-associated recombination protein A [Frankia sp. Cpl3]OHV41177.1 recombinase RarA [Parafrankia colletiae]
MSLFDADVPGLPDSSGPLAARLRPRNLDELVGQRHLLAAGSPLRRLVEGGGMTSVVLWGPPGTGKTTLAHIVSRAGRRRFRELSAVTAGVKDVRAVVDEARDTLSMSGVRTVLFIDEVHRFTRTQQDALLPSVEKGWVTLVAATTENPFFSVVSPLLSRSLLLTLEPLTDADIGELIERAVRDPRGYGGAVELTGEAREHLVRLAGGDARRALTALEAGAEAALEGAKRSAAATGSHGDGDGTGDVPGPVPLGLDLLERAVDRSAVRYDREGDQHYDVVSAFIKSMRGGDVDAALHYLTRMLEAGEDPRFVARRMVILASEDIGMADPGALGVAVSAAQALELVGLPEARLALGQAVIHLTLAPKSNAVITAMDAAAADVRAGRLGPVPSHLRDAHYRGATRLGHGAGYQYPHDHPEGVVRQQYAPDVLARSDYYRPSGHGFERRAGDRVRFLRGVLRGQPSSPSAPPAGDEG